MGKQPCPNCGREFEHLGQHKCPHAPQGPSGGGTSHGKSAASSNTKGKQPCPFCGREYERLGQHKCPAVASDEVPSCGNPSGTAAKTATKNKQPCPTCGRWFETLWQHKCHAVSSRGSGQQVCTGCGQAFKRLSQHRCESCTPLGSSDPDQDSNGYRPVIDVSALEEVAQRVMEALNLQASGYPKGEAITFFDDEVVVKQKDKDKANYAFSRFRDKIKMQLEESTECPKWDILNSGSSYDGTKVSRADEVVCMLFPNLPPAWLKITFEKAPPGFCFVEMTSSRVSRDDPYGRFLLDICGGQNRLSSKLFRQKTFEVLAKAVDDVRRARVDPEAKPGAASFPVLLDAFPRSSSDAGHGLRTISIDLLSALKLEGFPSDSDSSLRHVPDQDAEAIRRHGFQVIAKECSHLDPEAKQGAASFPVLLDAFPRSSSDAGHCLRPISIDLVPVLKLEGFPSDSDSNLRHVPDQDAEAIMKHGFHVIAKECSHREYHDVRHLLWRLSFPQAEKALTKFADRRVTITTDQDHDSPKPPPTCRRRVLRTLKRLLEIFKGIDNSRAYNSTREYLQNAVEFLKNHKGYGDIKIENFSTFQIRTLLWTEFYVTSPSPAVWGTSSHRTRLIDSLRKLLEMLSGRMRVTHFFLSDLDIMAEVPLRERQFLYILFSIALKLL